MIAIKSLLNFHSKNETNYNKCIVRITSGAVYEPYATGNVQYTKIYTVIH